MGNGFVWTVSVIAGYKSRWFAVGDIVLGLGYKLVSLKISLICSTVAVLRICIGSDVFLFVHSTSIPTTMLFMKLWIEEEKKTKKNSLTKTNKQIKKKTQDEYYSKCITRR